MRLQREWELLFYYKPGELMVRVNVTEPALFLSARISCGFLYRIKKVW